jgi:hypothetical protein
LLASWIRASTASGGVGVADIPRPRYAITEQIIALDWVDFPPGLGGFSFYSDSETEYSTNRHESPARVSRPESPVDRNCDMIQEEPGSWMSRMRWDNRYTLSIVVVLTRMDSCWPGILLGGLVYYLFTWYITCSPGITIHLG